MARFPSKPWSRGCDRGRGHAASGRDLTRDRRRQVGSRAAAGRGCNARKPGRTCARRPECRSVCWDARARQGCPAPRSPPMRPPVPQPNRRCDCPSRKTRTELQVACATAFADWDSPGALQALLQLVQVWAMKLVACSCTLALGCTARSARVGRARSEPERRPAPAASGRWLAREAPEVVSPHDHKPHAAPQSP